MKKILWIILFVFTLALTACSKTNDDSTLTSIEDYRCKDTPLAVGCYIPSDDLDFISVDPVEFLLNENFENERINSTPQNWLLYRDQEYATEGVIARITEHSGNRFVRMFSDGLKAPMFPQSAPTPTFILSSKFNLDIERKGVAYASVLIPSTSLLDTILGEQTSNSPIRQSNSVSVGVATGAVNTISVQITLDMKLNVRVGGPFFYHSGSGDGGDTIVTGLTLSKDVWYTFKYEWDASLNTISAYILQNDHYLLLYTGPFHISNRFNAESNNTIMVPNVIRVTMPRRNAGWAFLDNVLVERKGE